MSASSLTGGLIGETPDYSAMALRSEKRRKGIIDLGLNQIDAVFGGGQAPFYGLANSGGSTFDPKGTYFQQNKQGVFAPYWAPKTVSHFTNPWKPVGHQKETVVTGARPGGKFHESGFGTFQGSTVGPMLASGGGDVIAITGGKLLGMNKWFGKSESPKDIAKKQFRRGQLFNAPTLQNFQGFGPDFYKARTKAYLDYALPQVAQQYLQARNAQMYGLSNRGLLNSSQASQAKSQLESTAGLSRSQVGEEGINQANQLKQQVENSRQQAISQLYQTADPARAFQSAIGSAANLNVPSPFGPVTNMFANLAQQYYANQLMNLYNQPTGTNNNPAAGPFLAKY